MSAEELLKMLRDAGLDDEAIGNLLKDALASMSGEAVREDEMTPEEEDAEREEAGRLLGVEL